VFAQGELTPRGKVTLRLRGTRLLGKKGACWNKRNKPEKAIIKKGLLELSGGSSRSPLAKRSLICMGKPGGGSKNSTGKYPRNS